jgi:hypothetical protein
VDIQEVVSFTGDRYLVLTGTDPQPGRARSRPAGNSTCTGGAQRHSGQGYQWSALERPDHG